MHFRASLVLIAALCLAAVPQASAQAPSDSSDVAFSVQMADSLVVTASRFREPARSTGRRVTVYTQADIQNLAVTSVDQLLDVVGGLDVQSRGGFGVQSDLTLRGSTFNGVLLLLDGARINDPMTGHFLMDLPVPLSEIARVEVLRGPATALYGPDALGGVVQLFTRTGLREARMRNTGLAASAGARVGRYATHEVGASARRVTARTAVSAAAVTQSSDGQRVPASDGRVVLRENDPVRTDFTRRAATAAAAHALQNATLYARAGVDDRDFSAWHYYTPFASDKAREATSTYWTQLRLRSHTGSPTQWEAQVAAKQHEDRYAYNATAPASIHTSRLLTAQAQVSHRVRDVTLTGGASGQARGIDSNTLGVRSDVAAGAFASFRWQITPRLTVNQSMRLDADPLYGLEPTPQVFVAYGFDRVTLRAGGGRAVRAPNYIERYTDAGGNRGSADLEAEKAWSAEAGVDIQPGGGLALHATGFARTTRDLIDYAQTDPSEEVFIARNVHRVETLGLELEGTLDRRVGAARLHLGTAYTLLDATLDTDEAVTAYKYALTSARHLLQGTARVSAGPVTVGLQGVWKDRLANAPSTTDAYAVMHGRIGFRVAPGGVPATLSLEARNLFDRAYSEVFDAPMPGRMLMVGVTVGGG